MTIRHGASDRAFDAAVLIILCLFAVSIVLPFMNLVSISVSNEYAIMSNSVSIFPVGISFASYRTVLKNQMILHSFVNSVVVAGAGCVASLLMTSLASYPLAFGDFAGKRLYNLIIMLTMWFSGGMVPSFLVMSRLKLLDSFAALILMGLLSAYNILILSNFFRSIPLSLIESARIDGSNDFRTLFTIVIPLSKASLATIGLWVFVGHWNDSVKHIVRGRSSP